MTSLKNKTVLLTGASRGIGHDLACALAKEGAKLIVVAHPWHADDLKQCEKECQQCKECKGCEGHIVDLADSQAVQKFAEQCAGQGVDVLINNAGIFGGHKSEDQGPLKGNPNDWEKTMKVNALAPMRLTRALAPKMADKGEGYIINITDVEAYHTGPHHPSYSASKYALRGFSHSCYEMLRDKGIKVVEIAPGAVSSTGMAEKSDMHAGQGMIEPKDVVEAVMFCFRLSRNAVPEEIILKAAKSSR